MKDIWGVLLLMASLTGAVKGRSLPYIIPYAIAAVSALFLFYRGIFLKSKFAFLYTSAGWVSLTWIAGKAMEEAWGRSIVAWVPFGIMLLLTPLVGYAHQRVYRRFNPASIRGLEIEPGRNPQSFHLRNLLRNLWPFGKKLSQEQKLELITFDLGEEIQFKNR